MNYFHLGYSAETDDQDRWARRQAATEEVTHLLGKTIPELQRIIAEHEAYGWSLPERPILKVFGYTFEEIENLIRAQQTWIDEKEKLKKEIELADAVNIIKGAELRELQANYAMRGEYIKILMEKLQKYE